MTTIKERLGTLEVRVDNLETWAGPGQASALTTGLRDLRAELADIRRTLGQHTKVLDQHTKVLDQHTQTLADLAEAVREILRRLPATPADPPADR